MPDRRYRVLAVATHPVQYVSPIFRRMAAHPQLDFQVAYCSLRGAEAGHDPEFGAEVQWDVPLLDGYAWTHVPNRGSGSESFFGLFNPGLWEQIRRGDFDAVLTLWFPIAFMIFLCATILLFPRTFAGMQAYQDYVLNAFFWLFLGILFRLPTLVPSAQFATTVQLPHSYNLRMR